MLVKIDFNITSLIQTTCTFLGGSVKLEQLSHDVIMMKMILTMTMNVFLSQNSDLLRF